MTTDLNYTISGLVNDAYKTSNSFSFLFSNPGKEKYAVLVQLFGGTLRVGIEKNDTNAAAFPKFLYNSSKLYEFMHILTSSN